MGIEVCDAGGDFVLHLHCICVVAGPPAENMHEPPRKKRNWNLGEKIKKV